MTHLHQALSPAARRVMRRAARMQRQRGISLFIVLVVLLLTLIIVFGSLRVANQNESVVGNQSDAQRAMAAAEALVAAAQRDIRTNGKNCTAATCRFPRDMGEFYSLRASLGTDACGDGSVAEKPKGVCTPQSPGADVGGAVPTPAGYAFHAENVNVAGNPQVLTNGAHYTEFVTNIDAAAAGNFAQGNVGAGGSQVSLALDQAKSRYWVEVFPYDVSAGAIVASENLPVPDGTYPFIFRITAYAEGLKSGTSTTLRTYYVPFPRLPVS